jgi:thiamine pyrophosphate-dependent acetolactate synthase large subunit-like protein
MHALKDCDTLLMLGTDLPYQQFYPEDATVIQVDVRGSQIGRRTPVDIPPGRHSRRYRRGSLLPQIKANRSSTHLKTMTKHYAEDPQGARRAGHPLEADDPPAVPHPAHRRDGR